MKLAAAVLLLSASAAAATEPVPSEKSEFYRGTDLERQGKFTEAAEVYRALVDRSPADPFADDALRELGRLYEEKLSEPVKAAETYERLLRDYPQSRLAALARARVEFLRGALGPGNTSAAALAELNDVFFGMARRPRAETITRLEKLLADYPDFPEAPRAAYRLAVMHLEDQRLNAALARFRQIVDQWPKSEWAPRGQRGIGDVHLARGEMDLAASAYRALFRYGDETLDLAAAEALSRVDQARWRVRGTWASWIVLAAFTLAMIAIARRSTPTWRATARALIKPPAEALYFIPVAILFAAAAMTEHQAIGHAIEVIVGGALVIIWLSGSALEATRAKLGRARLPHILLHASSALLAISALCYIAVTREHLWDMLLETLSHGADR